MDNNIVLYDALVYYIGDICKGMLNLKLITWDEYDDIIDSCIQCDELDDLLKMFLSFEKIKSVVVDDHQKLKLTKRIVQNKLSEVFIWKTFQLHL